MPGEPAAPSIVHIGYHKTGTSWFQEQLYPLLTSHAYLPRRRVRRAFLFSHAFSFNPDDARQRLSLDENSPYVLCEEELSGSIWTGGHMGALSKELADRVRRVAPEAQVVIFVRNQVDMLASVYAQYIKRGGTHRPERLLFPAEHRRERWIKPFKVPLFCFEHFEYVGLIRHYRELFGADNVHVFAYEAFRQDPAGFVADFARRFGMTYDPDRVNFAPVNRSFRDRTMALARMLNHFTQRSVVDKRYLVSLPPKPIKWLPRWFNRTLLSGRTLAPEELLGEDILAFVRDTYGETNRLLAEETGLPLAAYGYPGMDAPRPGVGDGEPAE
jgi:hypothetical protein